MSHSIHLLPEHLIDQIKAGEVIERPGYLIKELIENSIDANSDIINIQLINNGLDLIRISDNGIGMGIEDLKLAFVRHATSKINKFDDLYRLSSFGFRGEALASIVAVSKLSCDSKKESENGNRIEFKNGELINIINKDLTDHGTTISVQDLFYNTPARLKFISSDIAEKNFIKRILCSFILNHPEIEFRVRIDDDQVKIFKKQDMEQRLSECFRSLDNFNSTFSSITKEYDNIHIDLFLSKTKTNKNLSASKNFILVNNRLINSPQIHSILSHQLSRDDENYPRYVLRITTPAPELDVNVHPNKIQVKFHDNGKVIALVKGALEETLKESPSNSNSSTAVGISEEETNTHHFSREHEAIWNIQSSPYFLLNKSSTIYTLKKSSLIKSILIKNVQAANIQTVPLLISEPIECPFTSVTERLCERFGFELDNLDEKTYALRSYPSLLSDYPYLKILKEIISLIDPNDSLESLIKKFYEKTSDFDEEIDPTLFRMDQIEDFWQDLVTNNQVKHLSPANIGSLFHE